MGELVSKSMQKFKFRFSFGNYHTGQPQGANLTTVNPLKCPFPNPLIPLNQIKQYGLFMCLKFELFLFFGCMTSNFISFSTQIFLLDDHWPGPKGGSR